ncbi:hypothetical protein B9G55_04810 [Saccharibacillus sp. O16]|nr:hypothetical protein B9G55_04810 [Saccharibacillus sp. O16]
MHARRIFWVKCCNLDFYSPRTGSSGVFRMYKKRVAKFIRYLYDIKQRYLNVRCLHKKEAWIMNEHSEHEDNKQEGFDPTRRESQQEQPEQHKQHEQHEEREDELPGEGLTRQLFQVMALMHRYQHHLRRDREHGGDPHRGQGRVLALLKLKPEITQKELTFLLNMRNQSLGELLVKLERSGFIEREPSASDRRVMNVKLTPAGAEAAEQAEQRQQEGDKLFESFTEEERLQFGEYLNRLLTELHKQMEGAEFPGRDPREFWERMGGPRPPFGPGGPGGRRGFGPGGRFRFADMKDDHRGHGPEDRRKFGFFGSWSGHHEPHRAME